MAGGLFGRNRGFHKKFKFIVEIDGITCFGFQKMSKVSAEIAVVEQREGGALLAVKDPGLVTVPAVTLSRGACFDLDMFNWFKETVNLLSQLGEADPNFRRNGTVIQQDRDGSELRQIPFTGAWPSVFEAGEWDNDASENVIEMTTLVYDTWDIQQP